MARFCANLTLLFQELPLAARFDAAAKAGFDAVELLWPDEADLTVPDLAAAARNAGVRFALIDTPRGNTFGTGALPGQSEAFAREIDQTLQTAFLLDATHVHVMAGLSDDPRSVETLMYNLFYACQLAPNKSIVIEPISRQAVPGYALHSFETALTILDEMRIPNCGLLLDSFHAQNMGLDPVALWENNKNLVRHIQVSGFPGRNEPRDSDAFSFTNFFEKLDEQGYKGVISGEYHPASDTAAGVDWFPKSHLRHLS